MKRKLELYVHIPFCIRKCAYCDFISAGWGSEIQTAYFSALRREIRLTAEKIREEVLVTSVFFGGGTPSVPDHREICRILDLLKSSFPFAADCEISLEANPGTLTEEKLKAYRETGFNRISLGCQAAQDGLLFKLGRIHTFKQVRESVDMIRKAGFTNLNLDLMSGLPDQTFADYEESLRAAALLGPEHISAYSLILEEGTPMYEQQAQLNFPDEETERKMYEETAAILSEYGYRQYEISNYAREGYACRHNIGYWDRTWYLGFGLSAASLFKTTRYTNTSDMKQYLTVFTQETEPDLSEIRTGLTELGQEDIMEETMFLGLRMRQGVSMTAFSEQFRVSMEEVYGPVIAKYKALGLLEQKEDRLCLTPEGISVSNVIFADFLLS